jgi:hypothetical protein
MLIVERIILVLLLVCVGLFVGTVVGAALFVPTDSGLAGPAIALAYGLGGGAAALTGGVIVARRLDRRSLRRSLLVAGVLVTAITVWIGYRLSVARAGESPPEGAAERVDLLTSPSDQSPAATTRADAR